MEKLLTKSVLVNVIYYRPDYRSILQEFIWTTDDIVPELVRVHRFLNFWREHIDAVIHQIEVAIPDDHTSRSWRSSDWYCRGYT